MVDFFELSSLKEEIDQLRKEKGNLMEELSVTKSELNFHKESHTSEEMLENEQKRHSEEELVLKSKVCIAFHTIFKDIIQFKRKIRMHRILYFA